MYKKIFTIIVVFTWFVPTYAQHYGDPNKHPDLYIPLCESDWQFRTPCLGIRMQDTLVTHVVVASASFATSYYLNEGDTCLLIQYYCPIANGAPQDTLFDYGANDLVIVKSRDGISDGHGHYDFKGFIDIGIYNNGKIVGGYNKTTYGITNTDFKASIIQKFIHYYTEGDTMIINAQCADTYNNRVAVKTKNGMAPDGFYVIRVKVNPDKYITESNYDNNVSVIPLKIKNNIVSINDSALLDNAPPTPTGFSGIPVWGSRKYVSLVWDSIPSLNQTEVTIKRDNVVIATGLKGHNYYDTSIPNNWKQSVYTIEATIQGLGTSKPYSFTIKKK